MYISDHYQESLGVSTIYEIQIHVPCTVLLDIQALYPRNLVPKVLLDTSEWYIDFSGDPLMRGAFHGGPEFDWFRAFLYLEAYVEPDSVLSPSTRRLTSSRFQYLPTTNIFHRDQSVLLWTTEVADSLPAHPRLRRFVVYHHLRMSRLFLDIP